MLSLPGQSPVSGQKVVVDFDGGLLSSDGGVLALREIEQRLRVADRLAACLKDPRDPEQITHTLADIIRFRLLMIAAGYEDGNDADTLRSDPMFKMALDLAPSERELCSQPTISRLENLPDARALLRMGRANGLDYILGVAPTTTLRKHIGDLEARVKAQYEAAPKMGKARRSREFYDGAKSLRRRLLRARPGGKSHQVHP